MPLVNDPSDNQLELGERGSLPVNPQFQDNIDPNGPSLWDAAFRRNNIVGTAIERAQNPKPKGTGVEGFDPSGYVPQGYEKVAQIFADAHSKQEVEWIRQQYDREQLDNHVISQHGGWGVAAAMATGAVDPVTLASMAIPVGGETRIAQGIRTALAAGLGSAGQEAAMQQLEVSRDAKSSALNIAASTVFGGVLGAAIRPHVPNREFNAVAEAAHADLHGPENVDNAMGPIDGVQRIIPENKAPTRETLDGYYESIAPLHAGAESPELGGVTATSQEYEAAAGAADHAAAAAPEEIAPLPKRNTKTPDAKEDSILQFLAKHEKGLSSVEAEAQGIDKEAFKQAEAHVGIKRAFRKNGMTFDEAATSLHESGYPVADEAGKSSPSVLLDRIQDELAGQPQQSNQNTRAVLEEAHEKQWDARVRDNLAEAVPDFAEHDVPQQDFSVLAAKAHEHDPEAVERLLEGQGSDEDIARQLQDIVDGGREDRLREYESQNGPEARPGTESAPSPAPELKLDDVPQGIDNPINRSGEQSFGAAGVATPDIRGEAIARGAGLLSKTLGRVSPGARLMNSPSLVVRKLLGELANIPETLEKNWKGIASANPIERILWGNEGLAYQGRKLRSIQYQTYRARMAEAGTPRISRSDFDEQVAYAMRRGDQHLIPEVAQAAQDTRAKIFDPLKERAIKLGLLPPDVTPQTADSYLMRQYDYQKINANSGKWLDLLQRGFVAQGVDAAEARDIAHKVTRNVMGSERGTMDWKVMDNVAESGRFKERTLTLPDSMLEEFLNSNIDQLSHSYLRSMAPEVEMTERFGSRDLSDQIGDVHDEYARLIEQAPDDAGKQKLYNQMDADLRDLTAVRDRLYGIFGQPKDPGNFFVRAGRLMRSVNALRLLGAATLAHFPDVANMMMKYGIPNTFAAMGRVITSKEAFNLTREEAKRMGAGLDLTMNTLASVLGDYSNHSGFAEQRIANKLTSTFTMLTGETPLITMVQQLTSTMAQDEIIRAAQKVAAGGELSATSAARFAGAGLDRDMLERIAGEHEANGVNVNGLNFGMSDKWADQEAARAFESAVLRDAHSVTLRPGVGDTPLFMSTEWGKTLRQFTTFGFAAQRTVVNPLAQGFAHGDPRAAQALMALVAGGTLSYVSKQTAAGQEIEPWNSPKFALEVLDKSNLMGWTSDAIYPALWSLGFSNLSRWSDRDPVETIGGPTAGMLAATYAQHLPAKFRASLEGDDQGGVKRSDVHFMRRMAPGQNLWFVRSHINDLEDRVGDAFDLQGTSNADRAAARETGT